MLQAPLQQKQNRARVREFVRTHAHCDYKKIIRQELYNNMIYVLRSTSTRRATLRDREAGSTSCNCSSLVYCLFNFNDKKLDRMLKPAEELHVSYLVFTCSKPKKKTNSLCLSTLFLFFIFFIIASYLHDSARTFYYYEEGKEECIQKRNESRRKKRR